MERRDTLKDCQAGKQPRRPQGLTWAQQQVQREKEKLERGMKKYARVR